jgi:hypothetical protein
MLVVAAGCGGSPSTECDGCQTMPSDNTNSAAPDMAEQPDPCPNGLVLCDGHCVDTSSDPNNCGACDMSAPYCTDGKPSCGPVGTPVPISGGWLCMDLTRDPYNCGAVGHDCRTEAPVGMLFDCSGGKCGGEFTVAPSPTPTATTNCIAECAKHGLNCDDHWFFDSGAWGGTAFNDYSFSVDWCSATIRAYYDNARCGCIKGDPCGDFMCASQAKTWCADETTVRSSPAMGTCTLGACSFPTTDVHCPHGCTDLGSGLTCNPDPCGLVACNSPPASSCVNATTLRSYASSGTCAGGTCSYTSTDKACTSPPSLCYQSAGSCANGQCSYPFADGVSCFTGGVCKSGQCLCTPSCGGKACGDDGCGGICGFCDVGQLCSSGNCVTDPNYCDPVANSGCATPNECILLPTEKTLCALAGSGTSGSTCSATVTCAGGYSCFGGICHHICHLGSNDDCFPGQVCSAVSGWATHGFCK